MLNIATLADTAQKMVAGGKGILAADESTATIGKRFDTINLASSAESRRDYREMLFGATEAMTKYISGVILYEETLGQSAANGTSFVEMIKAAGALPGIKVDSGAKSLALSQNETITEGLDGLGTRLAKFRDQGAVFAKWRAVIDIGPQMPSLNAVRANTQALARYAAICQAQGIVPIVEPEVLMDGGHDLATCERITNWVLKEQFQELYYAGVKLEAIVLKPNMVIAGMKAAHQNSAEEIAAATLRVLKNSVPASVPGIAFLSGGQSSVAATENLNAINSLAGRPWPISFSYGRALQAEALKAWGGKAEHVAQAQKIFTHRAKMNYLAARGEWNKGLEHSA